MTAYASTTVAVSKSQDGIRKILQSHDVRGVTFGEDFKDRNVQVRFAKVVEGNLRTVSVSIKIPEMPAKKRKRATRWIRGRMVYDRTPQERQEQMARTTYRALHYWLKSQFEAVDFGLLSFEQVFLSHFEWMMDGKTVTIGQSLIPILSRPALMAPNVDEILDGDVQEIMTAKKRK